MNSRRKLLKKLKKSNAIKEATELDYNKDGSVQINVGLKDADDFFSPFSYKTYELLDQNVVDYINMCESSIPLNEEISIDIHTENPTSYDMKKRIKSSIKRYYAEDVVLINKKLKRKTMLGISYFILGLVISFIEALFYSVLWDLYIDTILAVMGWLFLWDGIEIILEDRAELKRKQIRDYRLLNAKVHIRKYSRKIQKEFGIGDFEDDEY